MTDAVQAPHAQSPTSMPAAMSADTATTPKGTTPTGLQTAAELRQRRLIVLALNVVTYLLMLWAAAAILGTGGWSIIDIVMWVCFAIGTPWTVLGFWNSVIGLWLLHFHPNPMAEVAPYAPAGEAETPLTIKTAIFMTVRNEDPERAIRRLRTVTASVDATGQGAAFSYFVLSDTNDDALGDKEAKAVAAWQAQDPDRDRITYRRRTDNTGYKAGNVRDFCDKWGSQFELMLPLDADSVMSGPAIVRLVRMMQAHPKIGILQSLVVGMPSSSAFARIFQFGMRHGMRSYTMGQSWWVGDCGPFWGHNAVVRIKPFADSCHLPILPGGPPLGGHVLSHDQVEATLMRRAGYEVRVLPVENGSWEENPPTMLDFAKRDVRWCQGNMQYIKLLNLPGLHAMSRFQLVWAILMFLGIPAWTLMIALLPLEAWMKQGVPEFPGRRRHRSLRRLLPDVPDAEDRRPDRRCHDPGRGGALRRPRAVRGGRRARTRILLPAGRRVDHPHDHFHDRPRLRQIRHLGRPIARRLRHLMAHGGAGSVAATAVRHDRLRSAVADRARRVLVEPAADGWLSRRHAVRRRHGFADAGALVPETRAVRHPRRLRAAKGNHRGAEAIEHHW